MKNIPKKIYLVIGLNNNDEKVEDFNELDPDNITWSEERIFDRDILFKRGTEENNLWHTMNEEPMQIDVILYSEKENRIFDASYIGRDYFQVGKTKVKKEYFSKWCYRCELLELGK